MLKSKAIGRMFLKMVGVAILSLWVTWSPQAFAVNITLTDGNSTIDINADNQSGMYDWKVDGVDQMFQQWFWYRIGNAGPEAAIDTLSAAVVSGQDANSVTLTYSAGGLTVRVDYNLVGGTAGSYFSDVTEQILITNTTGSSMDLHFFQYSDFDLDNIIGGQTVEFLNANTVRQTGTATSMSETVITPAPTHHEANTFANTLNSLNDANPTTLNDVNSATGDATWAFQWDRTIGNNGVLLISKDKQISLIPEPASLLMLGSGLIGLASYGRKKFFSK